MVLIRVFVQAYLSTAHVKPRLRAKEFLRVSSEILADEETVTLVLPIRPPAQHSRTVAARRQAIAMFRQYAPTFIAATQRVGEE